MAVMQTFSNGAKKRLVQQLDNGLLTSGCFDIQFNQPDGKIISLAFKDQESFFFAILQPMSEANSSKFWITVESPSDNFIAAERYEQRDFNAALGRAYSWVQRVLDELLTEGNSHPDWFEDVEQKFEEMANGLSEPSKPFSSEEIKEWSQKFDDLLLRVETLEKDNLLQAGIVANLRHKLNQLQPHADRMPKKTWLKAMGRKVFDTLKQTAEGQTKAVSEGAMKALLQHYDPKQ